MWILVRKQTIWQPCFPGGRELWRPGGQQGNQIVQFFVYWAIVYFRQFFENYRSSLDCWATFFKLLTYVLIVTKMGWAAFWAMLSQTHLVTLMANLVWMH
jgi:hypothetical protein